MAVPRLKLPRLGDLDTGRPIPRPRLLGFAAGLVALLLLLAVSRLLFGGADLGERGPTPWGYLDE